MSIFLFILVLVC